jgi:serine protease Do
MKSMKRKVLFIVVPILLAAIMLLSGCITLTTSKPSNTSATGTTTSVTANPLTTSWTPTTASQVTITANGLPDIADIVAKVKPSVVSITTETTVLDFFNRQYTQEGAGSGWIIDSNGIIVTNNHVIEGAKTITITLDDDSSYQADVKSVATDSVNDLAIIKINAKNLPALKVGDSSKLRVGDWVLAIGNSLGMGTRATVGIVAQLNVTLQVDQNETLYNLIDTSAAINPGNSGGPLVNLAGEVVGITSAKIVATGAEATGFAITAQTAIPIIQELVNKGYVSHPWVGVGVYALNGDIATIRQLSLGTNTGALLTQVAAGSPAAQAGLKKYDVIVSIGEQKVTDVASFTYALNKCKIGQSVEIKYWRGTTQGTASVTPIETPTSQ